MSAYVPCTVNGLETTALLDTGAEISLMSFDVYNRLSDKPPLTDKYKLVGVSTEIDLDGWLVHNISIILGHQPCVSWKFVVASIKDPIIVGLDFLGHFGAVLNFVNYTLTLNKHIHDLSHCKTEDGNEFRSYRIKLDKKLVIPPLSVMRVTVPVDMPQDVDMVVTSSGHNKGALLPNTLIRTSDYVPLQFVNDTEKPVSLRAGHLVGYAVPCDAVLSEADVTHVQNVETEKTFELPEHLQGLYERSAKHLCPTEGNQVKNLLGQFQDIFSKGSYDLGCFTEVMHSIDTGNEPPVKQPLRRTPLGFEKEEEENLKLMLDIGVITESSSDWASAPVLVRKKDGSVRYCIDFRALNDKSRKDLFPLPSISQCLDQLCGNQYFSTLDMASGYWQIEIDPKDRHKTAFITKFGLFEHKRMAFGLCNAPATFQRVIQFVLRGLTWSKVLAYIDDVIILGKNFHDHLDNLKLTFERFRKYNLKLKPKKCSLFHSETLFLGRVVSSKGVSINPENIEKVKTWPVPKSVREVEQFLGFINYHRDHIPNYADITSILYKLTGSKAEFHWDTQEQEAFDLLKEKMITAPILSYPNAYDSFILDTDASNVAIGAALSQLQDEQERVISYGSFVLTPEQRKYCVTRKELLAVVRFTRQYRHYLLGRNFLIRTDHNSLTWLLHFKYIEGQLARWLEELSQFDMTVIHRPGVKHGNADGMSRIPDEITFCDCYRAGKDPMLLPCAKDECKYCPRAHSQWSRFNDDVDDVVPLAIRSIKSDSQVELTNTFLKKYTHLELKEAQINDPNIQKLIAFLTSGQEPEQKDLSICSPEVKYFFLNRSHLVLQDDLLYYQWTDNLCKKLLFIVPKSLREEVMTLNHDLPLTGHMGIDKTIQRIKKSFVWYGLNKDVELFVKSCVACNKNKKAPVKPRAPLGQYHAGSPMERLHIDILGPFTPSAKGNQYVLMIVDQFTKWLECFALPSQGAEEVARCVVDQFIARYGCPLEIHTDQGRNFDGKLFASICQLLQITKTRTTPYRPCSNGQVERYNRTLLQLIRCFLRNNQNTWDEYLQQLAGAIRSTVNRNTGFTPNMMMLGREVMGPVDLLFGNCDDKLDSSAEYVIKLKDILGQVHTLAREHLESSQLTQKRDYDLKLKVNTYEVGDFVYKLDQSKKKGQSPKLQPIWKGPLLVTQVLSPILFQVADRRKTYILHHDRLKPCGDREIPLWLRRKRHALLRSQEDSEPKVQENHPLPNNESLDLDSLFQEQVSDLDKSPIKQSVNLHDSKIDSNVSSPINETSDSHEQPADSANVSGDLSPTRAGRRRKRPRRLADYYV